MKLTFKSVCLGLFLAVVQTAIAGTTWYVDGVNGSDSNDCKSSTTACKTIGHAISVAASGDSMKVASATYSENLTIAISLNVIGAGAATTIIDGGAANTVVKISGLPTVTLSGLTIRNGLAQLGGGIYSSGSLTVLRSAITGNRGTGQLFSSVGAGIYMFGGTVTIIKSTVSGNSSVAGGSGIYGFDGNLIIDNSTISGNSGILLFSPAIEMGPIGSVTINSSTVSGNGSGVDAGTAYFQNTILANNFSNCFGTNTSITSKGYNLSSDGSCNLGGPGDLNNTDPELGPLRKNGGPTQTQALLSGSPAIDAGNPNGCTDSNGNLLKTDQRGKPRPDKEDTGGCDMGAYERQTD